MEIKTPKKLIEVALPLDDINIASAREKSIRHGHPSTLHLWWARRPLAAARAVLFAQLVNDPGYERNLQRGMNKEKAAIERDRLFEIIKKLVLWENTNNEEVLKEAREEIRKSWRETCALNKNHPQAAELFNPDKLPAFHDPFAGGGAIPLEAQRLGLESYASDLNPVAVLINKAMIEIPPKFAGKPPVGPTTQTRHGKSKATSVLSTPPSVISTPPFVISTEGRNLPTPQDSSHSFGMTAEYTASKLPGMEDWSGAKGLAEDVRRYGQWMRDEAFNRIGHLYPQIEITKDMAKERADLKPLIGQKLTVIAWLWARTVKSPNPAFSQVDVPLISTFMLSTKPGKEAFVEPVIEGGSYQFIVKMGVPKNAEQVKNGTKLARGANFRCIMSDSPIEQQHIRGEFCAKRAGVRLIAIVAESTRGRVYLSPNQDIEAIGQQAQPQWRPAIEMNQDSKDLPSGRGYGFKFWHELFTPRQLVALTTFSDLVHEAREKAKADAIKADFCNDGYGLDAGGTGAQAYADAVVSFLGLAVSRSTNTLNSLTVWSLSREQSVNLFSRQAIPMAWDFPEVNPFAEAAGDFGLTCNSMAKSLLGFSCTCANGLVFQADAAQQELSKNKLISTDPPYYDNICYADLSDFFYVWLRRTLKSVYPGLFSTLAVPKAEELVATSYRHGSKEAAEIFFMDGMTRAMHRLSEQSHPAFPVTIYYAFKQAETQGEGTASTG